MSVMVCGFLKNLYYISRVNLVYTFRYLCLLPSE